MRRPLLLLATLIPSLSFAQSVDVPLRNWTVPPYRATSANGGLSPMTDISPGIGFVAVTPCRIADTRGLGFTGQAGPPVLDTGTRTFQITGTVAGVPSQCGIPTGADAVSFQFTIVSPNSNGNLIAWPAGGAPPTISVLNWSAGETALGNGTIVPVSAAGALSVRINAAVGNATGHLVLDVNGYFTDEYSGGNRFLANASVPFGAAIAGVNSSSADLSTGIFGQAIAATGQTFGVRGLTLSTTNGATGVNGIATADTSNRTYGVWGEAHGGIASAGVFGTERTGVTSAHVSVDPAGVRGESVNNLGVVGITQLGHGVSGTVVSNVGSQLANGRLGFFAGAGTHYGVYSLGNAHVQGTFTATTNKGFVQPHPHDASKEIRYISLEGPHTEVYFRGTAQVSRGVTRIPIPQHFRFVADPATYSTLVTPFGAMATVAVLSQGPEGIVVEASRDVKVQYVVYAEREAVRNPDPIIENVHFRPEPERDVLAHLPDTFKQLMIQNGTLNADGSINMETARRLGWDKEWEKRARPAPQPID